jgi:hypothetical protein
MMWLCNDLCLLLPLYLCQHCDDHFSVVRVPLHTMQHSPSLVIIQRQHNYQRRQVNVALQISKVLFEQSCEVNQPDTWIRIRANNADG